MSSEQTSGEYDADTETIEPDNEIPVVDVEQVKNEEITSPIEAESERKSKYALKKGLLGKAINALLELIAKRHPEIRDELVLDEIESNLVDDAFKPVIEKLMKKAKMDSSMLLMALALIAIFLPRIFVILDAERKMKGAKTV